MENTFDPIKKMIRSLYGIYNKEDLKKIFKTMGIDIGCIKKLHGKSLKINEIENFYIIEMTKIKKDYWYDDFIDEGKCIVVKNKTCAGKIVYDYYPINFQNKYKKGERTC